MKDLKKVAHLGVGLAIKLLAGLFSVKLCAYYLGPENFGVSGQLGSLLSIISLLAGGGISAGITKIYAGGACPPESRSEWHRAGGRIVIIFICVLIIALLLAAEWIVSRLFNGFQNGYWLIAGLTLAVVPLSYAAIGQGRINGLHRDDLYAASLILGSLLGVLGLIFLGKLLGAEGALLGMIWVMVAQALAMVLIGRLLKDKKSSPVTEVVVTKFWTKARFLLGYGVLSISAGAVLPVTYIIIRLLIRAHGKGDEFGFWQATLRISEAYTQLPLLLLSTVLFARFAGSTSISVEFQKVKRAYALMAIVMGLITIFVYFTRNYWIKLVFTAEFQPMEAYLPWQLIGDALRIMSYVGTTILAAKGAVRVCVVGEFVQCALLLATNFVLTPLFDVYGAYAAYIFTYALYFGASVVFVLKLKNRSANAIAYS